MHNLAALNSKARMSRLTAAGYLENGKPNNHFSTSYKYDIMGNILTLRREGLLDSGDYGTIDDLTYSYEGNQVVKIDDAADESPNYSGAMHFRDAANEETEYTYDANGNMLTDSNKGITSIEYNVLDLPQCIKIRPIIIFKENAANAVYYTYSADGTKLRAKYKEADSRPMSNKPNVFKNKIELNINTNGMVTSMPRSLESNYYYCSNLVYNDDRLSTILFDGGYASVDEGGGIVMHFYVKDHLGSNRLVVDGNGNIEEVNHYYPFGALMGDRCGVSRNKYKYIGKELDTMYGWNMQDHEARWYDPVLGRWMATDPLQEKYASVSSYCYAANNPIRFVDTDGNSPFSVLIKYVAKKEVQIGVKIFIKRNIQNRLQKYMSKNILEQFVKDADDIISILDNSAWENVVELTPVVGDIYGSAKFVNKLRKVYNKLQDLENKYVDKIQNSLPKTQRKHFIERMRRQGVEDARKDQAKKLGHGGNLKYEKNKGIDGHHKESVLLHPDKMTDPRNIKFMYKKDHIKYHQKNEIE